MRMYRCLNPDCTEHPHGRPGFDFTTEGTTQPNGEPLECPKCGGTELTPLIPVHLIVADKAGPIKTGKGRRRIVCRPDLVKIQGRLTGETAAVTCPVCAASKEFETLKHEARALDEHEIPDVGTPLVTETPDVAKE